MPTTGDEMKLTQRNTNLCVSIAAMLLICFAFIVFLEKNIRQDKKSELKSLSESIIRNPKVPYSKKNDNVSIDQTSGKCLTLLDEPTHIDSDLIQILVKFNKPQLQKIMIRKINRHFYKNY